MFNHTRGLWGYTGVAADGEPLTVQSTGMGGPSAAIVIEELIALGARRLVRIGTCGALAAELELGDLVAAETVLSADGASAALGANGALGSDPAAAGAAGRRRARGRHRGQHATSSTTRARRAGAWVERGASWWRWRRAPSCRWRRGAGRRRRACWP